MESGYPPIRRVVTGHDGAHAAKVLIDAPASNAKYPQPGQVSTLMWCTDAAPANIAIGENPEDMGARILGTAPPPNGTRFTVIDLPPGNQAAHASYRDNRLRHCHGRRDRDGHGCLYRETQSRGYPDPARHQPCLGKPKRQARACCLRPGRCRTAWNWKAGNRLAKRAIRGSDQHAWLLRTAICVSSVVLAAAASAQNYPSAPVKLIVPVPAGGVTDVMARVVGQRLQEMWGQTVVVENRPGGNAGVGAQAVERSLPDGLTLLVSADSTFTANPALFSKLTYNADDFTPIGLLCRGTPMLMVHPSLPVNTVSGAHRLRQGQSGQAELRLLRYRHLRASQHGRPQAAHGNRHATRPVSRRRAGSERPPG